MTILNKEKGADKGLTTIWIHVDSNKNLDLVYLNMFS